MNTTVKSAADRRFWIFVTAILAVGSIIRIPQLAHSLAESYAFRQTQTAFTVREYAQHGINLFSTPLPVFGPDSSVPMEFPLFQAIASLIVPLGIRVDIAARLIGLLSFEVSAVLLFLLVLRWHGRAVAVTALALFEFLPFGLLWGGSSLIDFFSVALALTMVVGVDRWFATKSIPWLVVGSVAAILGFLVKVTTLPSWTILVLVSAFLIIRERGWAASWRRVLVGFITAPGLGLIAALLWTKYADGVKTSQDLEGFLTSSALRSWNFGTLSQRMDGQNYFVIFDRISQEIAGPGLVGLLLAVAAAIFAKAFPERMRTLGWLLVAISAPVVFFNLYVVHTYYLIAIYPAIVVATSIGLVWAVRLLPGAQWQRLAVGAVAIVLLFASTVTTNGGRTDLGQFFYSQPHPPIGDLLLTETQPGDLIVMIGCDWDPTYLYYAEREGVMFRDNDSNGFWDDHDVRDYSYLISCNSDLNARDFLPADTTTKATSSPGLLAIEHANG